MQKIIFVLKFEPMITKLTKTFALCLLVFATIACGGGDDGPDTQGPTVEITTPNTTEIYKRGEALPLVATFNDNRGLKDCKITIEYISGLPGSAELKGVGSPWSPAENNEVHTISFNGSKSQDVNEAQLFKEPIEAACLSGIYRLTFTMSDNATEPNVSTETIEIKIGN